MKRSTLNLLGVAVSVAMLGGCATVISGQTQTITVTSKTKKSFTLDGGKYITPAKVVVKRSKNNKVIKTRGCKDILLKSGTNPVVYGNILAGGVIGSSVDSGAAAWKYQDTVELCK